MGIKDGFSKQLTKINMKTSAFLEENKIKTYIGTLESDMAELYKQIGKASFEMWKEGNLNQETITPMFQELAEKETTIMEQQKLIQEMEERNRKVLGESAMVPSEESTQLFCSNCGNACGKEAKFCTKCGQKIQ